MNLAELTTNLINDLNGQIEAPHETGLLLISVVLGKPKTWVLAHPEYEVDSETSLLIYNFKCRILKKEPLPYILRRQEFFGLHFHVSPAVLIPRPETELLVENAIQWLNVHPTAVNVVDVGTGSGCIAIVLAKTFPRLRISAVDISGEVLEIARMNALQNGVTDQINFIHSDLLANVSGKFDLITANLPYIPSQKLDTVNSLDYEPLLALDGGKDGLELIRKLLLQAPAHINQTGLILLEIEESIGEISIQAAKKIFPSADITLHKDLAVKDRLISISL